MIVSVLLWNKLIPAMLLSSLKQIVHAVSPLPSAYTTPISVTFQMFIWKNDPDRCLRCSWDGWSVHLKKSWHSTFLGVSLNL